MIAAALTVTTCGTHQFAVVKVRAALLCVVRPSLWGEMVTVPVGAVSDGALALLRVTRESLEKAIAEVKVGGKLSDEVLLQLVLASLGASRWVP